MAEAFTREELEKIKLAKEKFGVGAVEKYISDRGKVDEFKERRDATLKKQPIKTETTTINKQPTQGVVNNVPTQQPTIQTGKVVGGVVTDTTPTRPAETVDNQITNKMVDEGKLPEPQQVTPTNGMTRGEAFELGAKALDTKQKNDRVKYAEKNNISYSIKGDKVVFSPEDLDEAISLYEEFGPSGVKLSKDSVESIKATKAYEIYSRYKGADSNTYYQGFKNNEIAVGGPNWDRLARMNGGEPTEEMLEAKRKWEESTQVSNVNNTGMIAGGTEIANFAEQAEGDLAKLDGAFINFMNSTYGDITQSFNDYKANNQELSDANNKKSTLAAEIDELNIAKRKVIDDTRERYPHLPLSQILSIADKKIEDIDNQLFEKQRSYQIAASEYAFLNEQAKAEYEHRVKTEQFKLDMGYKMYNLQRGDIIREENIKLAEAKLADERAYAEEQYNKAIQRQEEEAAKKFAYELALIEAKKNQNDDIWANYKAFGGDLVGKIDPETGEATFFRAGDIEGTSQTSTSVEDFIASSEGFSETAYQDSTGKWTIGYGTTSINGEPVKEGDTITKSEALDLMKQDIAKHSNWTTGIQVPLSEAQKTALSSFEYNLGPNIWSQGAGNILDMINKGNLQGAANEMAKYNKAENPKTGELEVLDGLTNRRNREGQLLMQTGDEGIRTERINGTDVILGSLEGVPVVFERVIKSQIPATLLNSEVELEAANQVIKNMYASGVSPEDASAMFQGFEVRDVEDLQFGSNLLKMTRSLTNKPEGLLGDLSASINAGDRRGAVSKIESLKEVEYQAKDKNAPIRNETKLSLKRLNNIVDYLEANSGPGLLEGKIEKYLGDFKTVDTAELETLMELYNASTRLELYGTSQTGGEAGSFRPLELSTDQKIGTILNKIKRLREDEINQLNTGRGLTLPSLNEEQILNDNSLINLYESSDVFKPVGGVSTQKTQPNTTSSSSTLNKYNSSTSDNGFKYNFNK